MNKMWSQNQEFDLETARDYVSKLVLLGSAQRAGIFEALTGERKLVELKSVLDADERALYIVIEALCSLGYVDKRNDKYIITGRSRSQFIKGGEEYVGGSLPHLLNIMEAWLALPGIIKGAKPDRSGRDVAAFMSAMASRPDNVMEEVVSHCLKRKKDAKNVLDLGGGPGKYSRIFVGKGLSAVLYDTPETIDHVRSHFGLGEIKNLALMKGDFTKDFVDEFAGRSFDIVFMGNICHIYSEKENRSIIERAAGILNAGGLIAIEDMVRGRSPLAEMFAVNMLANTEGGNTYTEKEYREWLRDAGFGKIEVSDIDESQLMTAIF